MLFSYDKNMGEVEVCIEAGKEEYKALSKKLFRIEGNVVLFPDGKSQYYIHELEAIKFILDKNNSPLLKIKIVEGKELIIKSNKKGFSNLGQSLDNFFNNNLVNSGRHLHLDYFKGSQIVAPTNCSIICQLIM